MAVGTILENLTWAIGLPLLEFYYLIWFIVKQHHHFSSCIVKFFWIFYYIYPSNQNFKLPAKLAKKGGGGGQGALTILELNV